jgi:hypothetical protein
MSQKFCQYIYVSGLKKGNKCGRFCRGGRELCFSHFNQLNKYNKKHTPIKEPNEEECKCEEKVDEKEITNPKPNVEILKINTTKKHVSSSSSSSSSCSFSDSSSSD